MGSAAWSRRTKRQRVASGGTATDSSLFTNALETGRNHCREVAEGTSHAEGAAKAEDDTPLLLPPSDLGKLTRAQLKHLSSTARATYKAQRAAFEAYMASGQGQASVAGTTGDTTFVREPHALLPQQEAASARSGKLDTLFPGGPGEWEGRLGRG